MSDKLNSASLAVARSTRLAILADIEAAMENLFQQEKLLEQSLQEAAPASIAQFLEDEGVIENLLKYGTLSTNIHYGDNSYGFKNAERVKKELLALKKAWQYAVEIRFSESQKHRIEIFMKTP